MTEILFVKGIAKRTHIWNWNNGMLEPWNDGFKETSIQNASYFIDFFVLMAYFLAGITRK